MEWYYAEGNQPRGPVVQEEFDRLVAAGSIKPETLVWCQGMANWQPYRTVGGGEGGGLVCGMCGRGFAPEEVRRRGDAWVCRSCEADLGSAGSIRVTAGGAGSRGGFTEAELLARDYAVQVNESLIRSWGLLREHAGLLIGASVLVYGILLLSGMVPGVGSIASLVIGGPLMGGLWLLFLRRSRGEEVSVGEAFGGFGPRFGQLLLGYVVPQLLSSLFLVPFVLAMFAVGFGSALTGEGNGPSAVSQAAIAMVALLALAGVAGAVYLQVSWFFTLPLIIDKRLSFWPAMALSRRRVGQHFWTTLLLLIAAWILLVVGMMLCGVGVIFTGPLAKGMVVFHYESAFGDLAEGE